VLASGALPIVAPSDDEGDDLSNSNNIRNDDDDDDDNAFAVNSTRGTALSGDDADRKPVDRC
jgi:hypothetical protein